MRRSIASTSRILLPLCLLPALSCLRDRDLPESETRFEQLTTDYIEAWKDFYPTSAVRLGLEEYLSEAEDRSPETIQDWVDFNADVMTRMAGAPEDLSADLLIDLRLITNRASSELTLWRDEQAHLSSPGMYSSVLRGLVAAPETTKAISEAELEAAMGERLAAVSRLTDAMAAQLVGGTMEEARNSIRTLGGLFPVIEALPERFPSLESSAASASEAVASAMAFIENDIEVTEAQSEFPLGRDRFAEELRQYYDMEITPEEVAERALREIEIVRDLIAGTSTEYWNEVHADEPIPTEVGDLVARASGDMEDNRPSTQQESLELFTLFAQEAETFVRDKGIATLPADRTLEIVLTPESAGPSQRIGFVDSAPPFDPEPITVLSLPTIPDSFPPQEKEDFYRSFNNHFNKFIIIHELFPGHYMQLKIASRNPRLTRTFFPYEPYVEGWATLVEKFALDAGWDDFNKLTYLAHLKKRLENANRAYTSVQLHCFGWTEEQVSQFSEERALLAPQFAKSLFGRLQRGPMQMTSYFMGKDMFMEVLEVEMDRLGEDFQVKTFTDVILNAGAVPIDMLPSLLVAASGPGS